MITSSSAARTSTSNPNCTSDRSCVSYPASARISIRFPMPRTIRSIAAPARRRMVNPKMSVAYAFTRNSELYADFGDSFHSNDVRGSTYVDDPQTHEPFDSTGAPVGQNPLLNRAIGEEIGYRYSVPRLTTHGCAVGTLSAK